MRCSFQDMKRQRWLKELYIEVAKQPWGFTRVMFQACTNKRDYSKYPSSIPRADDAHLVLGTKVLLCSKDIWLCLDNFNERWQGRQRGISGGLLIQK